jgi:hypothetical protein
MNRIQFNISIPKSNLLLIVPKLVVILFLIAVRYTSLAQVSDFIAVKKKNGITIKNFYEGISILFQAKDGEYIEGPIAKIHHDTVYVSIYNIQKLPTSLGNYVFDTLNTFTIGTNYKDIRRVSVYKKRGKLRRDVGVLMIVAGATYAVLNILNGAFSNLPITDPENLKKLGISAGLVAAGFINNKFFPPNSFSGKKNKIVYISLVK